MSGYENSKIGTPWKGYYITAYGIAVKHGFQGTEEEWLESLKGDRVQIRYDEEAKLLQWKYETAQQWETVTDLSQIYQKAEAAKQQATETAEDLEDHAQNLNNPHEVTAEQIGLGNVDNTADLDKPVSSAVQTALMGKAETEHQHSAADLTSGTLEAARLPVIPVEKGGTGGTTAAAARASLGAAAKETLDTHLADEDNPHHVTPLQVGGIPVVTTTTPAGKTEGTYYAAEVPGAPEPYPGMLLLVVIHKRSTSTQPTISLNGGAYHDIRRPSGRMTQTALTATVDYWMTENKPVLLMYNGYYWIALNAPITELDDVSGMLSIDRLCSGTNPQAARGYLDAAQQYLYGTTDPETAGVTLAEGQLYFVYE